MHRIVFRALCASRKSSVSALSAKCNKTAAPVFRVSNGGGVNALSTTSVSLCDKKDNAVPSYEDEKTNEDKEGGPAETGQTNVVEHSDEPVVLKADDGSALQQQVDTKIEEVVEKPTQVETDSPKIEKENLLDLLGTMKVIVTNKRKSLNHRMPSTSYWYSELRPEAVEDTSSVFQEATVESSTQSETLDPDLVAAASAAAATLPNSSQAKSELIRQLRQRKAITEAQKNGDINNIGAIIADMRVGKATDKQKGWMSDPVRFDDDGRSYSKRRGITHELGGVLRRNLLQRNRLNIFSPETDKDAVELTVAQPTLWDIEFANELSLSSNQMPCNGFDEMIQWTKEGKLWEYPINNEAGLEEEASVPFHEHIFLEKHLEEGFPRQGPVRHFMELVVAGLSRNPYLTVQQKKEHISWFKDYFHQKQEVLQEADVHLN